MSLRSSHTLFPPKERNPLLLCAEGVPSCKASAPLPSSYRLPSFRGATLLGAILLGRCSWGVTHLWCHPFEVPTLRNNPFGCCALGCCPFWGAVLLGCCPFGVPSFLGGVLLRYHPYRVRSLGCHPFCADCVFPKGNAGVQCYNGNILFYTVTQVYSVYCPPPMSQLHLS